MKIKLKVSRQHLDDLCRYFIPHMLDVLESRKLTQRNTELELAQIVCLSVLEDLDLMFQKKTLNTQTNISAKLSKAEGVILMQMMIQFPIPDDHFWRLNLRNHIVQQLHKQLV